MKRDAARLPVSSLHRRVFTKDRHFAQSLKVLPRQALRIDDPIFVTLGVAAFDFSLFQNRRTRSTNGARAQLRQLGGIIGLEPQMVHARLVAARRNRKIHARFLEHPLGIVCPLDRWLHPEQVGIESYALSKILDRNVNVESLHTNLLWNSSNIPECM